MMLERQRFADRLDLIRRELLVIPTTHDPVSISTGAGKMATTHLRNLPLKSSAAATASLAITPPGCSGLSSFPSSNRLLNLATSRPSMTACAVRTSACMSVSTTPGRTATVVMAGSSVASVPARWFRAALEEP